MDIEIRSNVAVHLTLGIHSLDGFAAGTRTWYIQA